MSLWQKGKKAFNSFPSGDSQTFWEAALASTSFSGLEGASTLSSRQSVLTKWGEFTRLCFCSTWHFLQKQCSAEHLSTEHVPTEAIMGRTSVSFRAGRLRFLVWHCSVMLSMRYIFVEPDSACQLQVT